MSATDENLNFSKKRLQDYEVLSVLGSGSFGTCYKVRDKETNKLYAWKAIDYDELDEIKLKSLASEISMLRQLSHPNIVHYYHHLNSNDAKSIFIITEWCENGDLNHLIMKARLEQKRFDERYIWRVLFQICKALQVCHSKLKHGTILHRDVKPANIFLDSNWNVKLGDFGLARLVQRSERFAKSFVGTPYYMSPEIIKNKRYDSKSDVWALGCLTYETAALQKPFKGSKMKQLSVNIKAGYVNKLSSVYSQDLNEIISIMLDISEAQRPSVEVIVRHPNVIKNIKNFEITIEPLIRAENDFLITQENDTSTRTKLQYSFSSIDESFNDLGRRLSVSGGFTPDLRKEIFNSTNRKFLQSHTLQQSDPELYENVDHRKEKAKNSPRTISHNIFHELLKERLHAIRTHEALLKQKEENLAYFEHKLSRKEHKLRDLEQKLLQKQTVLNNKIKHMHQRSKTKNVQISQELKKRVKLKSTNENDETYCTIEPQDVLSPTVAKLNIKALPPTKSLSKLRKVTFQSPKRVVTYNENKPPKWRNEQLINNKIRNSICSSSESSTSGSTNQRRKSVLSFLGIKRNSKETILNDNHLQIPNHNQPREILSKCENEALKNIWTKENKRAAFDLLATMNATTDSTKSTLNGFSCANIRQSMRHPTHHTLRRERINQSMRVISLEKET